MKNMIPGIILMAVVGFYAYYVIKNHDRLNKELNWVMEEYKKGEHGLLKEIDWLTEEVKRVDIYAKDKMINYILHRNSLVFEELAEAIVDELKVLEEKTNIPAIIGLAIIAVESNFDITAKGYKDKKLYGLGLMQINYKIWLSSNNKKNLYNAGVINKQSDLYKPRKNIRAGYYILNLYYEQCKKYQEEGRLNGLGFYNIYHCSANKYFGSSENQYYEKILKELGEYMLFTIQN